MDMGSAHAPAKAGTPHFSAMVNNDRRNDRCLLLHRCFGHALHSSWGSAAPFLVSAWGRWSRILTSEKGNRPQWPVDGKESRWRAQRKNPTATEEEQFGGGLGVRQINVNLDNILRLKLRLLKLREQ